MQSATKMIITAFSVLSLSTGALAGVNRIFNNCQFDIYCASAKGPENGAAIGTFTPTRLVAAGDEASFMSTDNNNVGVSLKCDVNEDLLHPYQLESTIKDGVAYYDLSAVDGDPFLAYKRTAVFPNGDHTTNCPVLHCEPGETSCEWPFMETCNTTGDILLVTC
ncbi:antigenic thaumatin domain-containing protein [Apiospora kogelbergensis]|uniref:Antigenic thaumatin domain-containing protein n=1 Tax=Apiospora kogelbergensis TaxID=1337665 RepID=A0AAW0RAD2_9PEZI